MDRHVGSVIVPLVGSLGDLVHALQKERGAASVFLASNGERFRTELTTLRRETDGSQAVFIEVCGRRELHNVVDMAEYRSARRTLARLAVVREQVDDHSIDAEASIEYMTDLNQSLLVLAGAVAQAVEVTGTRARLVALLALLRAKELAGIERALLAQVFSRDRFDTGGYLWLVSLLAAQEALMRIIDATGSPDVATDLARLNAHPAVQRTAAMEETALANGVGAFEVDPEEWFLAMTQRIDLLRGVEQDLLDDVTRVDERGDESRDPVLDEALSAAISAMREIRGLVDKIRWGDRSLRELLRGRRDQLGSAARQLAAAQRTAEQLASQATHDPLTGLANRSIVDALISDTLDRAATLPTTVAVMTIDLDHFKVINDSLGHDAGDRLLCAVAGRLQQGVRSCDTVARVGGDEFLVVSEPVTGIDEARSLARRVLDTLARPFSLDGRRLSVTMSIGVAVADGGPQTAAELLRDSDNAAYRAKHLGRNRVEIFDDDLRQAAIDRLETEQGLRAALDRDEVIAHLQPLVDAESGEVVAMESLARWRSLDGTLRLPGEFLGTAADAGLVPAIDDAVLRWALRNRPVVAGRQPPITANVSSLRLRQPNFAEHLIALTRAEQTEPSELWLEITEDGALTSPTAIENLVALREHGFTIALDDFGSGFSALSVLQTLPIDVVKLDGAFIQSLGTDPHARVIVESVLRIVATLGMRSVAEGVETAEQLDILRELRCDLIQGWLYAAAGPAEQNWDAVLGTEGDLRSVA